MYAMRPNMRVHPLSCVKWTLLCKSSSLCAPCENCATNTVFDRTLNNFAKEYHHTHHIFLFLLLKFFLIDLYLYQNKFYGYSCIHVLKLGWKCTITWYVTYRRRSNFARTNDTHPLLPSSLHIYTYINAVLFCWHLFLQVLFNVALVFGMYVRQCRPGNSGSLNCYGCSYTGIFTPYFCIWNINACIQILYTELLGVINICFKAQEFLLPLTTRKQFCGKFIIISLQIPPSKNVNYLLHTVLLCLIL
jgi:hypothetical protein